MRRKCFTDSMKYAGILVYCLVIFVDCIMLVLLFLTLIFLFNGEKGKDVAFRR